MKNKLILLVLFGFTLTIGGVNLLNVSSKSVQEQFKELDDADDKGSMNWYIRRAKIAGEKEVELPGLYTSHAYVADLNDALSRFRVIVTKPIEKFTEANDKWLVTWYKFKIINALSVNQLQECSDCTDSTHESDSLPAALLPLESDEILIPQIGGAIIISGIRVIQPPTLQLDFSTGSRVENTYNKKTLGKVIAAPQVPEHLLNTKQYLLFVSPSQSGRVASLAIGERGVFYFDSDIGLMAASKPDTNNILKTQLENLQINTLEKLKAYTQRIK